MRPGGRDITVRLSSSGQRLTPAQVAVSDGARRSDVDARLAIRIEGDSSVILVDMLPVPDAEEATRPHASAHAERRVASGVPNDIAFGRTDGGLRLAAVVPSTEALTLIDPATGIASQVDLGGAVRAALDRDRMVGPSESGADVALLWSTSSPEMAFVALGSTVGKPYKASSGWSSSEPIAGCSTCRRRTSD